MHRLRYVAHLQIHLHMNEIALHGRSMLYILVGCHGISNGFLLHRKFASSCLRNLHMDTESCNHLLHHGMHKKGTAEHHVCTPHWFLVYSSSSYPSFNAKAEME
uniref:Predicted protein n=1 Tax=Hordeum vulgare subsp. vulgare TaxID=112509 RepID=F2E818_HORVV|nr:predicted protein [Hordeum vulgare subsp. vulgare]